MKMLGYGYMIGHVDGGASGYGAVISPYDFVENLFIRLKSSSPYTFSWHADIHRYNSFMCVFV